MGMRKMKRSMRKAQGIPEKNALSPKGSTGEAKGPARSPTQREVFAAKRARAAALHAAEEAKSTLSPESKAA
jgi:hypothetical protein